MNRCPEPGVNLDYDNKEIYPGGVMSESFWKSLGDFMGYVAAAAILALLPILRAALTKIAQNRESVKSLWRIGLERGKLGASDPGKGLATLPTPYGPLQLTPQGRQLFAPILQELQDMGAAAQRAGSIDREELAEKIERRFRKFLLESVCSKIKMRDWECLALAYRIATETVDPLGHAGEQAG